MIRLRPVQHKDLKELYRLSAHAKAGLTTLPHDKKILEQRINLAVQSFNSQPSKPGVEYYFFVLEDLIKKKIIGTTGIFAKVGGFEPFYTYEIKKTIKYSKSLGIKKEIQYLQLKTEHNGPSEIGTLFLEPAYRKMRLGKLLSLSRFMFVAQYRKCFEKEIIAELRGVIDENESSPFWRCLAKHFFDIEFKKADLMVMKDKTFIADLMPKHPIYIPLLPKIAQDVIGEVHKNTIPALHLLLNQGFIKTNQIDIFEAGPTLKAKVSQIETVRKSKVYTVGEVTDRKLSGKDALIANIRAFDTFYVAQGKARLMKNNKLVIDTDLAKAIEVEKGGRVRVLFINQRKKR